MNIYVQETDSKIVFPVPSDEMSFAISPTLEDETIGTTLVSSFLPIPSVTNLISDAWLTVGSHENINIVKNAKRLLLNIQEIITTFKHFKFDLCYLPQFQAFIVDDGSLLIEWIFNHYRIGFSFENNQNESSWYLVSDNELGEISASGLIASIDNNKLLLWLINFVLTQA